MALNLQKIQDRFELVPDAHLVREVNKEPQTLKNLIAAGELNSRNQVRQSQQMAPDQPTVAEDVVQAAGGMGSLPIPMDPNAIPPEMAGGINTQMPMRSDRPPGMPVDPNAIPLQMAARPDVMDQGVTSLNTPSDMYNMNNGGIVGFAAGDYIYDQIQQVESGGNPYAESGAGAVGLMQLRPSTVYDPGAGNLARYSGLREARTPFEGMTKQEIREHILANPQSGRRFGEEYYDMLLDQFGGDPEKALTAYNWGPGNVRRHLAQSGGELDFSESGGMPDEAREYARKFELEGGSDRGWFERLNPIQSAEAAEAAQADFRNVPLETGAELSVDEELVASLREREQTLKHKLTYMTAEQAKSGEYYDEKSKAERVRWREELGDVQKTLYEIDPDSNIWKDLLVSGGVLLATRKWGSLGGLASLVGRIPGVTRAGKIVKEAVPTAVGAAAKARRTILGLPQPTKWSTSAIPSRIPVPVAERGLATLKTVGAAVPSTIVGAGKIARANVIPIAATTGASIYAGHRILGDDEFTPDVPGEIPESDDARRRRLAALEKEDDGKPIVTEQGETYDEMLRRFLKQPERFPSKESKSSRFADYLRSLGMHTGLRLAAGSPEINRRSLGSGLALAATESVPLVQEEQKLRATEDIEAQKLAESRRAHDLTAVLGFERNRAILSLGRISDSTKREEVFRRVRKDIKDNSPARYQLAAGLAKSEGGPGLFRFGGDDYAFNSDAFSIQMETGSPTAQKLFAALRNTTYSNRDDMTNAIASVLQQIEETDALNIALSSSGSTGGLSSGSPIIRHLQQSLFD